MKGQEESKEGQEKEDVEWQSKGRGVVEDQGEGKDKRGRN